MRSRRAAPKVKYEITNVRVLYAREILIRFFAVGKLLKVLVARDGIEPPTPAFSGPLTVLMTDKFHFMQEPTAL